MTALYVTHDQAEAVVLGDRIGVMRDGKLLQMGTPDEIYNRPADLFVANFTGATNALAGTLIERNGRFGIVDIGGGQRVEVALLHELNRRRKDPHRPAAGKYCDRPPQGQQCASCASARPPLSGYADDLRHRPVRPETGSLELGTAARYEVGANVPLSLPRDALWAYRDQSSAVEWSRPSAHGDVKS